IGAGSAIAIGNSATLNLVNLGPTFANSITNNIGGAATVTVNTTAGLTISGALSDNSTSSETLALTLGGTGTTILTNSANTYTGATLITGGATSTGGPTATLQVGTSMAAGSIGNTSLVSIS